MNPKRVRLLVWKEFLQLRRDPLLVRVIFLMPILQLVLFGYVVSADVTNLRTAVVDLDRSTVSRQIEDAFASSGYFVIAAHPAGEDELPAMLDRGDVSVAVVIPRGTQAALDRQETAPVGVIVDGADGQSSGVALGYAGQIITQVNANRLVASGLAAPSGNGGGTGSAAGVPSVDARVRVLFNPSLKSVNAMLPGLIGMICMVSVMVVMSQAVVRERESGTLEQMFVTPITRAEYLTGKVIPYALVAFAQALLVAVVGVLWFRVPFHGNVWVVVVGLVLFMLTSIGLGLLISLVSRTRHQAQQTVMFVMIPAMVLSGFIFPLESMPKEVLPVAYAIPMTWVLDVMRGSFVRGAGFGELAVPLVVLGAFAVVIFGAALVATGRRLQG